MGKTNKLTTEEFIRRAKEVHGDKYDYSKVEYKNSQTKVCIICPEHGEFWQIPNNHLRGANCGKCLGKTMDTEYFKQCAKSIHGNKYDYSKVEYVNTFTEVTIICPIHGEFKQKPREHLSGCGCQKCGNKTVWDKRGRISTEEFIKHAKQIHGDKYDYSKVEYINSRTPVCIICRKKNKKQIEHGEFWQTPKDHLSGRGCPHCRNSYLENKIRNLFFKNNINFVQEKTFSWLKNEEGNHLFLDFYLPDYNIAIECQGVQHFIPLKGNVDKFKSIKNNDKLKNKLCSDNGIKLLYFTNKVIAKNYTDMQIIFNENNLLNEIKNA